MDRRAFLQAGAGLGLSLTGFGATAAVPDKQYQKGASPWPLCLNTSTIRPTPLKDKIQIAAETGYDAVELWIDDLEKHEVDGGDLKALGAEIKDRGLFVINVIGLWGGMPAGEDEWQKSLEATRNRMRMSAAVGSKHVAVLPLPDRDDFDLKWAAGKYKELLNLGRNDYGILPAFEFVGFFKTVYRLGQAAAVALDANDADAKIIADTFHLHRGGSGFEGIRHLNGNFIASFHWNDVPAEPPADQLKDEHRIYPGDGILPIKRALQQLAEIGYTGPLSLELFNREHWQQDPKQVAATGREKILAGVTAALG
ncbi:MAG: sugar phosphate isomerase/epimerase [Candidatus Hydrogenedentes bacterium]|nr:sugar phosphate isomerase/epimerase [Candidatus Hydrogenedentota bacterium]